MNQKNIIDWAKANREKAFMVKQESGVIKIWEDAGCRVNLIGSLRMDLMARNRDIDLHVYSSDITEESTFAIAAKMSKLPGVSEITGINGLHTEERCMAWHVKYLTGDGEIWKFDIIHIEAGTKYDGFFERMADRITSVVSETQRNTILRLKFETPEEELIHGVEYYEAVIADGISTLADLRKWVIEHREKPQYYWIP